MIIGIGIDIIEIDRVIAATKNKRFLKRCFTEKEEKLCESNKLSYASNFATKEAFVKAVGQGFGKITPNMIEVLRDEKGKPYICLHDYAKDFTESLGAKNIFVSISHNKDSVVANVIIE